MHKNIQNGNCLRSSSSRRAKTHASRRGRAPASFIFLLLPPQGDDEMLFVGVVMSSMCCCRWHLWARQMQENVGQMPQLPASVQPEGEEDSREERAPLGMRRPGQASRCLAGAASVPRAHGGSRGGASAVAPAAGKREQLLLQGRQGGRRQGPALSPRRRAPVGRRGLQHLPWLDSVGELPASGVRVPESGFRSQPGPLVPPGVGHS